MLIKCYISKGKLLGFSFDSQIKSGSGNDYRSSSQREEKDPRTSHLP